jgi:hypothetical protein
MSQLTRPELLGTRERLIRGIVSPVISFGHGLVPQDSRTKSCHRHLLTRKTRHCQHADSCYPGVRQQELSINISQVGFMEDVAEGLCKTIFVFCVHSMCKLDWARHMLRRIHAVGGCRSTFLLPRLKTLVPVRHLLCNASRKDLEQQQQRSSRCGTRQRGSCMAWHDMAHAWHAMQNNCM